jgi:hypothetical protein
MLMSDSLGGNAKTLMFVNASPADYNNSESNSSLAFANRYVIYTYVLVYISMYAYACRRIYVCSYTRIDIWTYFYLHIYSFIKRCKDITNNVDKAGAGAGVQAAQMQALKKELAKLKKKNPVKESAGGGGRAPPGGPPPA